MATSGAGAGTDEADEVPDGAASGAGSDAVGGGTAATGVGADGPGAATLGADGEPPVADPPALPGAGETLRCAAHPAATSMLAPMATALTPFMH
jgi:hypothetical protein